MENAMVEMIFQNAAGGLVTNGMTAQQMLSIGLQTGLKRPWLSERDGRAYVTLMGNNYPVNRDLGLLINSTLRKDEWKVIDDAVIRIQRERLNLINMMIARGLTRDLDGMASSVYQYEKISDMTDAHVGMDPTARGERDRPVFTPGYIPLPLIWKDFQVNARDLAESRTKNTPLDTTAVETMTRKVLEKAESIFIAGASSFAFGGGTLRGLLDYPDRNTVSLTANWDTLDSSGLAGEDIVNDVINMIEAAVADNFHGPYALLIPSAYQTVLENDYKAASDKTIRQRILEISGVESVTTVDKMTADNVVLVQLSSDVIQLIRGLDVRVVEWDIEGGFMTNYKVLAIYVPRPMSDKEGRCGIVHAS